MSSDGLIISLHPVHTISIGRTLFSRCGAKLFPGVRHAQMLFCTRMIQQKQVLDPILFPHSRFHSFRSLRKPVQRGLLRKLLHKAICKCGGHFGADIIDGALSLEESTFTLVLFGLLAMFQNSFMSLSGSGKSIA